MEDYNPPDPPKYKAPLPWIGMYAAAASLLCFLAIAADAFTAFRTKKLWFPCKFFTLNAATLTLLAVAMKMPLDVSSAMYGTTDQIAKLSSTALMCIVTANFMPSFGPMDDNEIITNITAFGILVITVVVNICIQLVTGVIPPEILVPHVAVNVFMLVLFVISIFSACTVATTKKCLELKYSEIHKIASSSGEETGKLTAEKLKEYVKKYWMLAETGSPQFVMARSVICSASGTAAVGVGVIGSAFRWFTAIKFICTKSRSKCCTIGLKPENYWTERLVEWKKSPLVLRIRDPKFRKLVQCTKNLVLNLCIMVQIVIIVGSKLIMLISILFIGPLLSGYYYCSKLWRTSGHASNNHKLDFGIYVLRLEGEEELPESTLKNISYAADRFIHKAKKRQPKNLTELLQKSTNDFKRTVEFDSNRVPSILDSQERPNCWALPVVTLTSIVIAIPKINQNIVDQLRLVQSVSEGLLYVRLVDESMDAKGNLTDIRDAADKVWLGVDLHRQWLDEDLSNIARKGTSCRETFQILADVAQNTVAKYKTDINGRFKVIAANSMYKIRKTLLLDNVGNNDQTHDKLFERLSGMIVGILGACLTNLPGVITMKCFSSAIEKREKSVQLAARLLGETEEILKILEQHHQLLCLNNVDQFVSIDEWRAKMGQTNPSASLSPSSNDLAASGSAELAIIVELEA